MLNELSASVALIVYQTQTNALVLTKIIAVPWLVYFLNIILGHRLFYLGIIPRRPMSLAGIFFAPFLHANFNHLFFNTIPLLVLSNFLLINGVNFFLMVTLYIMLLSGFLIWCFAKPGIYIGASAVITGYWGLLVTNIYEQGSLTAIILGGLSLYYFAGIFFGLFPNKKGVSWEGHVFGLISGFFVSYLLYS